MMDTTTNTVLDAFEEAIPPYTLWYFFIPELLLVGGMEALRLGYNPGEQVSLISLIILFGLYTVFQIVVPFYKQPKFDTHWLWVSLISVGMLIFLMGNLYHELDWPTAKETIITGTMLIISGHLTLALINTLREPRPFEVMAPLWLVFLGIAFGFIGFLYQVMEWKGAEEFLAVSAIINSVTAGLIVLLFYFNWTQYRYLLFYLIRILWFAWMGAQFLWKTYG